MSQSENKRDAESNTFRDESSSNFRNCHRTKNKSGQPTEDYNGSDQDSQRSKEVVTEDNRPRKDGPGGN